MGWKCWPRWLKWINSICGLFILLGLGFIVYEFSYCAITNLCDWGPVAAITYFLPITGIFIAIFLLSIFMNFLLMNKLFVGKIISFLGLLISSGLAYWSVLYEPCLKYHECPSLNQIWINYGFFGRFFAFGIPLFILAYFIFFNWLFFKKKKQVLPRQS